jgi:riboflavin synthase alpha subunit
LRRAEIQGKLKHISLREAKRLLRQIKKESADLDAGQSVRLNQYCFAVEQALEREIRKLEGIRGH